MGRGGTHDWKIPNGDPAVLLGGKGLVLVGYSLENERLEHKVMEGLVGR